LDHGFVSVGIPLAFAFRQAGSSLPRPRIRPKPARAVAAVRIAAQPRRPAPAARPQPKEITAEKATAETEHWIEQARHLANQGKLVEALKCCEQNLRSQPASADTFHLVGLLHDAAGRVHEAAEHYRKALYLDPQHAEALVHLAVALQKEGDEHGAQRLFARANRRLGPGESKGSG
jgi:chemotaxis protein methyltransferase WspC